MIILKYSLEPLTTVIFEYAYTVVKMSTHDNAYSFINSKDLGDWPSDRMLIFHYSFVYNFLPTKLEAVLSGAIAPGKTQIFQYIIKTDITVSITSIHDECFVPRNNDLLVTKLNLIMYGTHGPLHTIKCGDPQLHYGMRKINLLGSGGI